MKITWYGSEKMFQKFNSGVLAQYTHKHPIMAVIPVKTGIHRNVGFVNHFPLITGGLRGILDSPKHIQIPPAPFGKGGEHL